MYLAEEEEDGEVEAAVTAATARVLVVDEEDVEEGAVVVVAVAVLRVGDEVEFGYAVVEEVKSDGDKDEDEDGRRAMGGAGGCSRCC